ncbi:MAG: ATP-binding protein [Bdellovibrionota bacterium]|nr:ATP-binding protein [Bdellovibrionota bacterium]
MKIQSFIKDQYSLIPVEVEVSCINGTHEFDIMGQPDSMIKEVKSKVFSSFRSCGLEVPTSKKIFINLRPNHIKKSSLGLDLPIALGILWETGQLPLPKQDRPFVYGELGLDAKVYQPLDIDFIEARLLQDDYLYTGKSNAPLDFRRFEFESLYQFAEGSCVEADVLKFDQSYPEVDEIYISKELADLSAVIALGEHSAIFAGPKGSGKSTIVENLAKSLKPLRTEKFSELKQIGKYFGEERHHRPIVSPHHSSTEISMIGGGAKATPGEFTRAHGGVLIMDEFLEFPPRVQEALREPMESGKVHLARAGERRTHPADFLLLATSNLCPCGDFYPSKKNRCICRITARQRYIEKLSGPVLDRFQIFHYAANVKDKDEVYLPDHINKIRQRQADFLKHPVSSKCSLQDIEKHMDDKTDFNKNQYFTNLSRRRKKACFQLSLSFARWRGENKICQKDFDRALVYTVKNFEEFRYAISKSM